MKRKYYLAYGANTNFDGMKNRCPRAQFVGITTLPNMRLVFRGVADVVDAQGDETAVAIWSITEQCEEALDFFEGFPRLYVKRYVNVEVEGEQHRAMLYVMRSQSHQALPYISYEECLRTGYRQCSMDAGQIDRAIQRVKDRARRVANGELPAHKIQPPGTKRVEYSPRVEPSYYAQGSLPLPKPPAREEKSKRAVIVRTPKYLQPVKKADPEALPNQMFRAFRKALLLED